MNRASGDVETGRHEALTAVAFQIKKVAIFWDIPPCNLYKNRCLRVTYRLHLQGRKLAEQETSVQPNDRSRRWPLQQLRGTHRNFHCKKQFVLVSVIRRRRYKQLPKRRLPLEAIRAVPYALTGAVKLLQKSRDTGTTRDMVLAFVPAALEPLVSRGSP
jgi:hypothetical protein